MIKQVSISNYALIDTTEILLDGGFSIVTGETGAGKSILLGAIGLTLGQRADSGAMFDHQRKCVVEIIYNVKQYTLESWFIANDLDYTDEVVVRREITPEGRSRSFINDTPVNNKILKEFGTYLIDIHSQHQTLLLAQPEYQISVLDAFCGNKENVVRYQQSYKQYLHLQRRLVELREQISLFHKEKEYLQFQFNRLDEAQLKEQEQESLEKELKLLSNTETIKAGLLSLTHLLRDKDDSTISQIKHASKLADDLTSLVESAESYPARLQSCLLELVDIADECEQIGESMEYDRRRIDQIDGRLTILYDLQRKYGVASVNELLIQKDEYEQRLLSMESGEEQVTVLEEELKTKEMELIDRANIIHKQREGALEQFSGQMNDLLKELGIKHANFVIRLERLTHFTSTGQDQVTFLFAANKNQELGELAKVASGGETSRVMLSLKYILSKCKQLPVIVFDEIDTGVSGEVAHKMAQMMKEMSNNMQVVSISHLPQLASMGDAHYKVYKEDHGERSISCIKRLTHEERIMEIAAMISGKEITQAALDTAKDLLN